VAREKKQTTKSNSAKQAAHARIVREKKRSRPAAPMFTRSRRESSESKSSLKASAAGEAADQSAGSTVVTLDRRGGIDRRTGQDRRHEQVPVAVERRGLERRAKVPRRRQIDPTTCERDYSADEIEFMRALEAYKRSSGRMFPTCSEILEVLRNLGYQKQAIATPAEPIKSDEVEESAEAAV